MINPRNAQSVVIFGHMSALQLVSRDLNLSVIIVDMYLIKRKNLMLKHKIGFIGSQGTGKTTMMFELAVFLKKAKQDVSILSEVARSCPLPINEETTKESQFWIFGKQLTREQTMKGKILISDRTLLDVLLYSARKFPNISNTLKPFVREYMKTYTAIIYLPPNDKYLLKDNIRSVDKRFRDEIDKLAKEMLEELAISYIHLDDYSPEKILELVK